MLTINYDTKALRELTLISSSVHQKNIYSFPGKNILKLRPRQLMQMLDRINLSI